MKTERYSWGSRKGSARPMHQFLYGLVAATLLVVAAAPVKKVMAQTATTGPTLAVNVAGSRYPISPNIYGFNNPGLDPSINSLAKELHTSVVRWGGDATTRYNWQVDSSNSGGDWFFMGGSGSSNPTPSGMTDNLVRTDKAFGGQTIITIPIIGYVNKTSAWNCSFPVSQYGQQQATNPYVHPNGDDCGNGIAPNGTLLTDNNPLANSIVSDPTFMQGWLQHFQSVFGNAAHGGVQFYQMDNEPSGWGNTHRDVHPGSTSYDDLRDRTYAYASMVKATDPSAKVLGPSDFGWPVYVGLNSDVQEHGGVWDAEWYLSQMQAYQQQHGVRILDYFDEHYYPAEAGIANQPAGDANTQALRLRSTRSLWDPTYTDESWIGSYYPPIQLIPLFHKWVNKDYPGTKIALTEYNWGGLESINGALVEADILGIFGRERLDLATLWGSPTPTQPGAYAFRMYLNYDGQGSKYGNTWVSSTSADQGQLAIYGAQRSTDHAATLMIINKTGNDLTSNLTLKGFSPAASAQVYTYSGANLSAIVQQPNQAVSATGFSATYPANSITLVVLTPANP